MQLLVDIRWRRSGGRGEYEHVPAHILLDRRIIIDTVVVPGARIVTDVIGRIRDGKPRLRRDNHTDRSLLNVPQLLAALALLPDSRREDTGSLTLPIKSKQYLISRISLRCDVSHPDIAVCTPLRMQILHYSGEIDLTLRLSRVGALLRGEIIPLPESVRYTAQKFLTVIKAGKPSAEIRKIADRLLEWICSDSGASAYLDEPGEELLLDEVPAQSDAVSFDSLDADETRRRWRMHLKLDRSLTLRKAKISAFIEKNDRVYCENCEFDFQSKYGLRGAGFIEVHHRVALAGLLPNTITKLSDLMLLCSNCHRIVHRRRPDLTPEELSAITCRGTNSSANLSSG